MNSIEQLKWRYATKKFDKNKKLSTDQIDTLKNGFNLTATSYGLQPLKLLVISNEILKKDLLEHSYNQQQIVDCSHLLVLCIKTVIDSDYVDDKFNLEKEIRDVSEEVVGGFRAFLKDAIHKQPKEDIENSCVNQAYIALGNLMTLCAFEKIDSCPMEGFIADKFDKILDLKKQNLKSVLCFL